MAPWWEETGNRRVPDRGVEGAVQYRDLSGDPLGLPALALNSGPLSPGAPPSPHRVQHRGSHSWGLKLRVRDAEMGVPRCCLQPGRGAGLGNGPGPGTPAPPPPSGLIRGDSAGGLGQRHLLRAPQLQGMCAWLTGLPCPLLPKCSRASLSRNFTPVYHLCCSLSF